MALVVAVVGAVVAAFLLTLWGINDWAIGAPNTELHLDDVNWKDAHTFEAAGTVEHLNEDDEVWVFTQSADGFSGVLPQGECEVEGIAYTCTATLKTSDESGFGYVVTTAVLTRKAANEIRSTPRDRLIAYPDAEGIPKIDDLGAIDDITTWLP